MFPYNHIKLLIFCTLMVCCGHSQNVAHIKPTYITSQGFNVVCEDKDDCYTKRDVEIAIDIVISNMAQVFPNNYPDEYVNSILGSDGSQYGWHTIYFVKKQEGPIGSCPRDGEPERTCKGFRCNYSETGWCNGLTYSIIDRYGFETVNLKIAKAYKCIAAGPLVHELIHAFHRIFLRKTDPTHSWAHYWISACTEELIPDAEERNTCKLNSIERVSAWELCKASCPDTCF